MTRTPDHLFYEVGTTREYCLRFPAESADRTILFVPPLFDEMNRSRRMIVETMRYLAAHGVASIFPDLPGCNESISPLEQQSVTQWRAAIAAAAAQLGATHIASLRGGCLLDDAAAVPICRLAPTTGASLLKTLFRTRIAADREAGIVTGIDELRNLGVRDSIDLAGHMIGPKMLRELEVATPTSANHMVEITLTDVDGTPLWLRAEPGESAAMSAAYAHYLQQWSSGCGK